MKSVQQILLITDGHSNRGGNPIEAAKVANSNGIVVNVIGITDFGNLGEKGVREVKAISQAGEGFCEIIPMREIGHTMHMLTCRATRHAIETVVDQELQKILGKTVKDLPPERRVSILNLIDNISEQVRLECCLLIDVSGSMNNKIAEVKSQVFDLVESLKSRLGETYLSIIVFPGKKSDIEFLSSLSLISQQVNLDFNNVRVGGITPTAPAIYEAVKSFGGQFEEDNFEEPVFAEHVF